MLTHGSLRNWSKTGDICDLRARTLLRVLQSHGLMYGSNPDLGVVEIGLVGPWDPGIG